MDEVWRGWDGSAVEVMGFSEAFFLGGLGWVGWCTVNCLKFFAFATKHDMT